MSSLALRSLDQEIDFRRSRQGVFGGSDAPAVFGFSGYRDALDVYHEKTRPIVREEVAEDLDRANIHIFRGRRNEADAIALYLEERGYAGRRESAQSGSTEYPHLAVHVDGTVYADETRDPDWLRGTGVIEAKSPYVATFGRLVSEGIGAEYLMQLQFNLAVTGRTWGALVFFCDHHEAGPILSVEAPLDPKLGRLMMERAERFMTEHVERRVPPDPADWSLAEEPEVNETLLDRSGEYVLVEDEAFLEGVARPLVERYVLSRETKKAYEDLAPEAEAWITENLDSDAVQLPGGDKLRVVRLAGRRYLDPKRLAGHRPIDRDAFVRWLRDRIEADQISGVWGLDPDGTADDLELDLGRMEKVSAPSSHVRVFPKKSTD